MKSHVKPLMLFSLGAIIMLNSCSRDDEVIVDTEKPIVTIDYENGFPQACSELQRGHSYTIRAMTSDNLGVASYSIDIHNNFDHHTHDNQNVACELASIKVPVNPLIFMDSYSLDNKLSHEIQQEITIPENIDTGDYHFQISATDISGWQGRAFIDIKIVE